MILSARAFVWVAATTFLIHANSIFLYDGIRSAEEEEIKIAFYVSSDGNDVWSGKLAAPNRANTDGPFRSIARARDALRERQKVTAPGPLMVCLRGGVYELKEPLSFTSQDSGTARAPIVYGAYPGESPVLSGGRLITGWRQSQGGLWSARVMGGRERGWEFHQLFVNGKRRQRARTPNAGSYFNVDGLIATGGGTARFSYRGSDIRPEWAQDGNVEIVGLNQWQQYRTPIRSVDEASRTVTLSQQVPLTYNEVNSRYWIENTFDALDVPGEWYLNKREGVIYYRPLPGEDMGRAEIVVPVLEQLIRFAGDGLARPVHDITVRGLALKYADWSEQAEGFIGRQAATDVPGILDAKFARSITIEKCTVEHIGSYAFAFGKGSKGNHIVGNEFTDLGAGAIKIGDALSDVHPKYPPDRRSEAGGGRSALPSQPPFGIMPSQRRRPGDGDTSVGQGGPLYPEDPADYNRGPTYPNSDNETSSENIISDNRIHDIGLVYPGAVAIWIGQSYGNKVSHNEIYDTYYSGISCGWTWGFGPSAARDNIVEFNLLHHIGLGVMSDMGAIYLLGDQPGTVIRNNVIYEVRRNRQPAGYGGWGIYLDSTAGEMLVEDNLVYDTDDAGLVQNQGQENTIKNNIFAFGRTAQFQRNRGAYKPSFTYEHNIVYYDQGSLIRILPWKGQLTSDFNLYYHVGGRPIELQFGGRTASYKDWQSLGQDLHSVVVDPAFVDAEHRNFTLRPSSPAFTIGFKVFDTAQAGPVR